MPTVPRALELCSADQAAAGGGARREPREVPSHGCGPAPAPGHLLPVSEARRSLHSSLHTDSKPLVLEQHWPTWLQEREESRVEPSVPARH